MSHLHARLTVVGNQDHCPHFEERVQTEPYDVVRGAFHYT